MKLTLADLINTKKKLSASQFYNLALSLIRKIKLIDQISPADICIENININLNDKKPIEQVEFIQLIKTAESISDSAHNLKYTTEILNKIGDVLLKIGQNQTEELCQKQHDLKAFAFKLISTNVRSYFFTLKDVETELISTFHNKIENQLIETKNSEYIEVIEDLLFQHSSEDISTYPFLISIFGDHGQGKTTLIENIKSKLTNNPFGYHCLTIKSHFYKLNKPYSFFQLLLNKILDLILQQNTDFIDLWKQAISIKLTVQEKYILTQVFSDRFAFFLNLGEIPSHETLKITPNTFIKLYHNFNELIDEFKLINGQLLLIIDDFDDFDNASINLFLEILNDPHPSKHKNIIISAKNNFKNKIILAPEIIQYNQIELKNLNIENILNLILIQLNKNNCTLNSFQDTTLIKLAEFIKYSTLGNPKLTKKTISHLINNKFIHFDESSLNIYWSEVDIQKEFQKYKTHLESNIINLSTNQINILKIIVLFNSNIHKENLRFLFIREPCFEKDLEYLIFLKIIDLDESLNLYINHKSEFEFQNLLSAKEKEILTLKVIYTFFQFRENFLFTPHSPELIDFVGKKLSRKSPLNERKDFALIKAQYAIEVHSLKIMSEALEVLSQSEWIKFNSEYNVLLRQFHSLLVEKNNLPQIQNILKNQMVLKNEKIRTIKNNNSLNDLYKELPAEKVYTYLKSLETNQSLQEKIINFLKFSNENLNFKEVKLILESSQNKFIVSQIKKFLYDETRTLDNFFSESIFSYIQQITDPIFVSTTNKDELDPEVSSKILIKDKYFIINDIQSLLLIPLHFNGLNFGAIVFENLVLNSKNIISDLKNIVERLSPYLKNTSLNYQLEKERKKRTFSDKLLSQKEQELKSSIRALELSQKTKNQFLANMSHEIKNPLNAILGLTEILKINNCTEKERLEKIEIILNSGRQLLSFLNNILNLAKAESGNLTIEKLSFNPLKLITDVFDLYTEQAMQKGLIIETEFNGPIEKMYLGDSVRISQIISNLMSNAIKFTNTGKISISASISSNDNINWNLYFTIADSGIGVLKEDEYKLFQNFSQLENHPIKKLEGTGLGLSICKHVCELMKGDIQYQANKPCGSIFKFYVPLELDTEPLLKKTTLINEALDVNIPILIIEDNPVNCLVISKMLENLGFKYQVAYNGRQGFEKIKTENFQVIFMDCQMPEIDGFECATLIRNWEKTNIAKRNKHIIIALTASNENEIIKKCFAAGMNYHITKPINFTELQKILTQQFTPPVFY